MSLKCNLNRGGSSSYGFLLGFMDRYLARKQLSTNCENWVLGIKKAAKGVSAAQPRGVTTIAMDDDTSEAEADDAAVQEQLLAFQTAHVVAALQAQQAQLTTPVTATHLDLGMAPPAAAEVEAAAAASAAAMTSSRP